MHLLRISKTNEAGFYGKEYGRSCQIAEISHPPYASGVGYFVLAVNTGACWPLAGFGSDMERWVKDLKATPSQLEINKSYFPGELEAASDVRLSKDSIVLPSETADELRSNAQNSALQPRSSG